MQGQLPCTPGPRPGRMRRGGDGTSPGPRNSTLSGSAPSPAPFSFDLGLPLRLQQHCLTRPGCPPPTGLHWPCSFGNAQSRPPEPRPGRSGPAGRHEDPCGQPQLRSALQPGPRCRRLRRRPRRSSGREEEGHGAAATEAPGPPRLQPHFLQAAAAQPASHRVRFRAGCVPARPPPARRPPTVCAPACLRFLRAEHTLGEQHHACHGQTPAATTAAGR